VTLYPTIEEVIAVHARLIVAFGGSLGIRDRGALEAALARPQSGYYSDLIQEAAALGRVSPKTTPSSMEINELPLRLPPHS
jgi:prophage maintenance system killer protein